MNPQDPLQPNPPSDQMPANPQSQQPSQPTTLPTQQTSPATPPKQHIGDELEVMQEGEVKLFDMKRHPIGIIFIYLIISAVLIAVGILAFSVLPSSGGSGGERLGLGVFAITVLLSLLYALVASTVYWGNRWILTTDSLTQITMVSLFGKQSSQLALSNIEDVTSEQHGILAHLFNFGTIKAETAGHHGKFVFVYAPNPKYYAQQILQAREAVVLAGGGHRH